MLKPCDIKNCPNCFCVKNIIYCNRYHEPCYTIKDCIIKQCLQKCQDRCTYIGNKLSSCVGYSPEEKIIRMEEHLWIINEIGRLLDIEVRDGNS